MPFPGATLTDTFQIAEAGDRADTSLIPANSERIEKQLATDITVVVGNPPYSAGQSSANDDNANVKYPTLDARIADTYASASTRTRVASIYDSYVRAFRWATDRIGDQGVVVFVSNNGWVDSNSADGIRKTFASEFSHVWVYNLRGNQRTAGETSRREGGKVFGSGARTGVAVLIALKKPGADGCQISYHGVPDYQTQEEKLADINTASLATTSWQAITPNDEGDWLNQRNEAFSAFPVLGTKDRVTNSTAFFGIYSLGLSTNRDAWCYNFGRSAVEGHMERMIRFYNHMAANSEGVSARLDMDATKISWSRGLVSDALKGRQFEFKEDRIYQSLYRPFNKQRAYFDRPLNNMVYQLEKLFPTTQHPNLGIYVVGEGSSVPFGVIATDLLPNLHVTGAGSGGQFFPRWTYEYSGGDGALFASNQDDVDEHGYRRVDNITDEILAVYRTKYGSQVTKDDIFYYVYGVLHSQQYRTTFAADLKRMLPRIPLAASREDFEVFTDAGRKLADLHINYESVEPYPLHEQSVAGIDDWELYRVEKMRWADKTTKKAIVYNRHITLSDIPDEAHRYMLGSRSALEWLIDRYQVKTDKASGIVNDPNDWAKEHDHSRYIIDLIKRVTRVSVDTMKIVDNLPELPI
ncbi:MAG: DEAD/DEAH box helicase [Austwickia sp.]|nr:DEAD/DEAH box helicase [Austwickia sp.]